MTVWKYFYILNFIHVHLYMLEEGHLHFSLAFNLEIPPFEDNDFTEWKDSEFMFLIVIILYGTE